MIGCRKADLREITRHKDLQRYEWSYRWREGAVPSFLLLLHISTQPSAIVILHPSTQASATRSRRRHATLTAWPISCTLRPVESPPGMPKASEVQPISSSPGLKEEPRLAQGAAKAANESPEGSLSGSDGGCQRGQCGRGQTDSYLVRGWALCHSQQHSGFVLLGRL